MARVSEKERKLRRRKRHIRKRLVGTPERPRLSIFRSSKHIYVQIIDDLNGRTLASASSLKLEVPGGTCEGAKSVGAAIAEAAKASSVERVCLDRGGRLYHGRIKALADAAREAGLKF